VEFQTPEMFDEAVRAEHMYLVWTIEEAEAVATAACSAPISDRRKKAIVVRPAAPRRVSRDAEGDQRPVLRALRVPRDRRDRPAEKRPPPLAHVARPPLMPTSAFVYVG